MLPPIDPPNAYPKLDPAVRDHMKRELLDSLPEGKEIWVFGYGSLMWNPGFEHEEIQSVILKGWSRSFCVQSHRYRGTPEVPGLVLGLDQGGECHGSAIRCSADQARPAMDYLWEREMVTGVYEPAIVHPNNEHGETLSCHTFVVDRHHPQYAGDLSEDETISMIVRAHGSAGSNRDYLLNTVKHLDDCGIIDPPLHRLADYVGQGGADI
ncbi:gamma-glutamylcyclotransferase [Curvivirga sp.]|uniref:gamma-glutamylcyclotransferase n=1 Tax=Curvivirga sp. TaxID=2856848 RepID=UPI003B5A2F6E